MSIQFLGMIGHRLSSETIAPVGPIFDRDYIVRFAQTHEAAGFDRLLVGHWSDQPDGFLVTALAGLSTQKIQYLLAHRPGFVSPTLAARKFATLEHLLGAAWRCISSAAATMPSSAGMAIISTTTSATPAPTPSSTPCARCGPASSRWIFTTISIRPSRPGPPFARCKAASSHLLRRLVGSGHRRRRQTCRRLRAVGRVAGANRRDHPAGARRSGETPA